jgi:4-hydroxy-tetrahydrodipicolinate synthase
MAAINLSGLFTAIITPFSEDGKKIDFVAFASLVEKQMQAGVQGIVPCGTTGESPALSHEEHQKLIDETVRMVDRRALVIGGTGSNSTAEARELTAAACRAGVDAVMLVNPYYNKPNQEGLFQHFCEVARAAGSTPVVIYNIKGRTGVNVENATMLRLLALDNIVAVKEASGDILQMAALHRAAGERLTILSGDDLLTPAVMSIGGSGVISVVSNLYPLKTRKMLEAFQAGDYLKGRLLFYKLMPLMEACFWDTNPIPVKKAASLLGLCQPSLRLPMTELGADKSSQLQALLTETGADE